MIEQRSAQVCEDCGKRIPETDSRGDCPDCGGLLEIAHESGSDPSSLKELFAERRGQIGGVEQSGVWRYRELVLPTAADVDVVSHPEGNTPVMQRPTLSEFTGVEQFWIKHEGHNPTGSFKDRGMTVAITQARRTGASAVACASTGNTSASLAAYAAHAGLPALVFVPAGHVALGKIAQTIAYGARTARRRRLESRRAVECERSSRVNGLREALSRRPPCFRDCRPAARSNPAAPNPTARAARRRSSFGPRGGTGSRN